MEPLFLKPLFMYRIWGGSELKNKFNYDIPSDSTGECKFTYDKAFALYRVLESNMDIICSHI